MMKEPAKAMAEGYEDLPRDAKIVKSVLKSVGVEDYEPRVMHQFLELCYSYVLDIFTDAQVYSEHDGKSTIDCDDVKLAIQSKVKFQLFRTPAMGGPGIPLPPNQDTFICPNYEIAIYKRQRQPEEETEEDEESVDPRSSQEQRVGFAATDFSKSIISFVHLLLRK